MARDQSTNKFKYPPDEIERGMHRYGYELLKHKPKFARKLVELNRDALSLWGDILHEEWDGKRRRASLRGLKGATYLLIHGADGKGKYSNPSTDMVRFLEAAKTVSASPSQTPPAIGSPTRKSSTIF